MQSNVNMEMFLTLKLSDGQGNRKFQIENAKQIQTLAVYTNLMSLNNVYQT